ncbi:MAG: hypothetical protein PHD95_03360 [Candidatus ainarchaeum sp.]|nr:hypothetical protein [Candidatus ainarchaeum sp.]
MKKKIFFALFLVLVLALSGCQESKSKYVHEMSSAAFWSEAQIVITNKDSGIFEKIPSLDKFPIDIGYSIPDKFKWEKGYYEKIFVKNNEGDWQEIFEAGKDAKAMAGMSGHRGDILKEIPAQNDSEKEFVTFDGRNGTLKQYSIDTSAITLYFKIAVFDSQGEKLLEKIKSLYSPFMLKLTIFSKTGSELAGTISEKDFPIKICYDWSALEKWQYGDYYEKIVLFPKANRAIDILFQGASEFHDAAAGDDPRNTKKSDCVIVETSKQNSPKNDLANAAAIPEKTENGWKGFSTAYDFELDRRDTISLSGTIHAKNTIMGETEIELNSSKNPAEPVQPAQHKKDLSLKIEFDTYLAQKIETNPENAGKSALQAVLENLEIEISSEKTNNFEINGSEIMLKDVGIIAEGETKKIVLSSRITGFTGKGVEISISLSQADLDKGEKIILRLSELANSSSGQ